MCSLNLLENDSLLIAGRKFSSRLMLGTGKYANFQEAKDSIMLSGCEILTVAVRRAQNSNVEGIDTLLNNLDWTKNLVNAEYGWLPNVRTSNSLRFPKP